MQKDCPKAANLLFLYKYLPDGETWPATYYCYSQTYLLSDA